MNTLEAGKNYVMANGEETGPLGVLASGRFRSPHVKAIAPSGTRSVGCNQVWNADGSVYLPTAEEIKQHTIRLDFPKRWEAVTTYTLANGFVDVDLFAFEEFDELAAHIEGGRDFHTVEEISIRLNPDHLASMFIKKAD